MAKFSDFMIETNKAMNAFGKYVVQQSRSRLIRKTKYRNKGTKGDLYKAIEYTEAKSANSISIRFPFMKDFDYAKYQDLGVKGTKSNYIENKNTPFKYGSGTGKNGGLTKSIDKWVRRKRFQFQVKEGKRKGQFMSYKTMTFLISRSIYQKGIPAKHFFSKSFNMGFERLPKELVEAFALDIKEAFKKFTTS